MTTTTASWRGLIARLDTPTTDGRLLVSNSFAAAHFVRLPVPAYVMPKPAHLTEPPVATSTGLSELCGRVDRVSVRRRDHLNAPEGLDLYGEGVVDLGVVYRIRPDLDLGNTRTAADGPDPLWPVGITVDGGELEGDPNAGMVQMTGTWELTSLTIEHQPSVWPGVGIELVEIQNDGRIES